MSSKKYSKSELAELAQTERWLIVALIAGVVIAIVGMALSLSFGSERLMNLTLLRSVAGLGAVYFYFQMIKRARLPNAVAYGLVALVCAFVAPLITWILIGVHIARVNRDVFRARGYAVGLLGPDTA